MGDGEAVVAKGGDARPKRSSEADGAGGGWGLLCWGCSDGDAKPPKKSCPEEIEVVCD